MTAINPDASIQLHTARRHIVATVPLTGQVSAEWIGSYQRLARATGVPARAEQGPDGARLIVRVSADCSSAEAAETMDAAGSLLADADASAARAHSRAGTAETAISDWWRRRSQPGARGAIPRHEVVRTGIGADRRWSIAAALLIVIAVQLLLPARFSLGPNWIFPAVEASLLAGIIGADRFRPGRRADVVRVLCFALVFVLAVGAAFVAGRLVVDLVEGGPETNSAADLLRVGGGVWIYTVIAFAFLYWQLDGRGPERRIWDPPEFPDLAFPQQLNPGVAPPGWRPEFPDYLYLGFTNATAFSPTDVMPVARWGKLAMTVQSIASLAILGLVIARAVNIFS
jgi:uncharacterized membrane protein